VALFAGIEYKKEISFFIFGVGVGLTANNIAHS
jgi:hypothetical protein